eukprot:scaffold48191_cov20-Tisochrysis_lutea.AAC.3
MKGYHAFTTIPAASVSTLRMTKAMVVCTMNFMLRNRCTRCSGQCNAAAERGTDGCGQTGGCVASLCLPAGCILVDRGG